MKLQHLLPVAALALPLAASAQTVTLPTLDFESTAWQSLGVFDTWEASPFRTGALTGNCALLSNPTTGELNPIDGTPVNPSAKVLAVQRSRYGSNTFGARITLNQPFDLTPTPKYVHAWIHTPKAGRAMIIGLGKRKDRPGQSDEVVQFAQITGSSLEADRWQEIVLPAAGNEGVQIHSLVIVPHCESPHDLTEDFAAYIDNVSVNDSPAPSLITGYYPISVDKKQAYTRTDRHLDIVRLSVDGKQQVFNVPTPRTVYTDAGNAEFFAKAGDVVTPSVTYNGTWMHSYVYLDKNQDGKFDPDTELVSYSYYKGKNSEGQTVSNGNTIAPRPFTVPADLAPGIYRLRYKIDWDNNDPLGSADVLKHGGAFVDIRLNVHGEHAVVTQHNLNGEIITTDGQKLESFKAPFGQPFTIKMNPADGFEYAGVIVKHGYHLTADSISKDNVQWQTIRVPRSIFNADNTFTLPAEWMNGNVDLEGLFIETGTYKPEPAPQWYSRFTPTTLVDGKFAHGSQWYSMQIGQEGYVLKANNTKQTLELTDTEVNPEDGKQLWCFVGNNAEGFRIYNLAAGTGYVLAAPTNMGNDKGGSSFPTLQPVGSIPQGYSSVWRFADSKDLGKSGPAYAYMYEDKYEANKVNNRNSKLAFWNGGADKGSTLTILPVTSNLTTSVAGVSAQTASSTATYDLAGRRVGHSTRGVLVQQGKVVLR